MNRSFHLGGRRPRVLLRRFGATAAIAATMLLAGCASFSAQRFDLKTGDKPRGLYVFDEVPLLVLANGQASVVMVKSTDRGMAVQFSAFLAKHDVSLDFFNTGGLSKVTSNQDATALPLAFVDLAKAAVDKLPSGLGLSKTDAVASTVQVYRIHFENGEIASLTPLLNADAGQFIAVPAPPTPAGTPIGDVNARATTPPPCDPAKLAPGTTCPATVPAK